MPLKSFSSKADFDAAYNIGAEPGGFPGSRPEVRLGYSRAVMYPMAETNAAKMVELLGLTTNMKIGILGCGFGWTLEALEALGFTNVIGTDLSTYIQANKTISEEADIDAAIQATGLDPASGDGATIKTRLFGQGGARSKLASKILAEDGNSNPSRNRIKNALGGGNLTWGISESVLECLTDSECVSLSNAGHNYCNNIAHLVVTTRPGQQAGYNWKTLEEWKALLPNDTFIEIGTWRVL